MGKLSLANLKKTIYYLKRNGLKNTISAAKERLDEKEEYQVTILSAQKKMELRKKAAKQIVEWNQSEKAAPSFSILVPAFRTNPAFLKDLVDSVREQVYPLWELLILDASGDESVKTALSDLGCDEDDRIRYEKLSENGGISENTNAGIALATGDYVGLLDHDDILTPDALYEMALALRSVEKTPLVVYSDEDKWDGAEQYYECNRKEDFNLDLLLSNNYICHFLVMEKALFAKLKLRKAFDGAQDYDLVLRATAEILAQNLAPETMIKHVPKVLYHWRCHSASTAENPQSKLYAYEAGKRALQEFADGQGFKATAEDLRHVGFYRLRYEDILESRKDLGAVGGKVLTKGALTGGRMAEDGSIFYEGLKAEYSGYLHRGVLTQDAEAVDLRAIRVRKEFWPLFEEVVGVPYEANAVDGVFDAKKLPKEKDSKALGLAFGKALRAQGKRILWDPEWIVKE